MVPDAFFKAVLRQDGDGVYQAIAFMFKNDSTRQPLKDAVVSVDCLETIFGHNLFTNLGKDVELIVESQASWNDWQ